MPFVDLSYENAVNVTLRSSAGRYSLMRESVYAEDATELFGQSDDPDGWEMTSASVKGTFFHQQDVEVIIRVRSSSLSLLIEKSTDMGVGSTRAYDGLTSLL